MDTTKTMDETEITMHLIRSGGMQYFDQWGPVSREVYELQQIGRKLDRIILLLENR